MSASSTDGGPGAKPGSGHLVNPFDLAAGKGLLHILLPSVGEPEAVETPGKDVKNG